MQIHVRKYFESKYDKEIYPSKKGIAFTVPEWRDLKNQISVIDECIECRKTCYERKQEKLNKSLIEEMYDSYHHQISTMGMDANILFQFQEEEKMPHQQQNYVYDNPIGFHQKRGQQFYLPLPDTYSADANVPFQFQGK